MAIFLNFLLIILAFFPLITFQAVIPVGKSLFIRGIISLSLTMFSACYIYSPLFRRQIFYKFQELKKNKIILSVLAYFVIFTIGVALATDKFTSFWGGPLRSEGFIGIFFYILFFFLVLALFEKKHWVWFFRLSLITGLILFIHQMFQYFQGIGRSGSVAGNPSFLAVYFLFIIFSALMVLVPYEVDRHRRSLVRTGWAWIAGAMIPLSMIGILITGTRGAILGLGVGIVAILAYWAITGPKVAILKKFNLRHLSVVILALFVIFSATFLVTKNSSFWQAIPGVNRLTQISLKDPTTQSRIINAKISFNSVDPGKNGISKFLFGWGWENFEIAWNKYYDPELYLYDKTSFDRAHNKLMDVLVMNGILGLLAYLSIWFFYFRTIFKMLGARSQLLVASYLFFGVSFFIQNLFLFDNIISSIPFFILLASAVFYLNKNYSHES